MKTIKLKITEDDNGELRAHGLVTISEAAQIIGKKSPTSVNRLAEAGLVRVVWVSGARCFIVKDLEKVKANNLTPSPLKK